MSTKMSVTSKVYVWDLFVRVFHWSLVTLFVVSYVSGENEYWVHVYSGYTIVTLVILRVLWGVAGSQYARFKEFLYAPATTIEYAKSLFSGRPKRYLGHNPLGGLMVVALLATLLITGFSGMKLYAVEEGKGPFAQTISAQLISSAQADDDEYEDHDGYNGGHGSDEEDEFWEEVHEVAVSLMIILIVLHISGVILSSRQHKESLVKAMMTGYKEREEPKK